VRERERESEGDEGQRQPRGGITEQGEHRYRYQDIELGLE
jgi:hypothetical protein